MINIKFEVNFYNDKRIVHIEPDIYAKRPRTALKFALHFMPNDIEFDSVKVFWV